jgi:hypothetical protein
MSKKVLAVLASGLMLSACTHIIPKEWRAPTVEERGLQWAKRLCTQFGHTPGQVLTQCIEDRYDQYLLDHQR